MSQPPPEVQRLPDPAEHRMAPVLQRIPFSLRMTAYTFAFLGMMLVVLPAAFYQLDRFVPAVHIDIGAGWWVGLAWFVASLLGYIYVSMQLTIRGQGPFVEFDPPKKLVVEGPYRYSRNPVVFMLMSTLFGEALALSSTGILLMFIVFCILGSIQVVQFEEPLLRQRYGDEYVDYCRRVPRWFPRWSRAG